MKIPSLNAESLFSNEEFSAKMIKKAEQAALAASAVQPLTASALESGDYDLNIGEGGDAFTIPLLIPEEVAAITAISRESSISLIECHAIDCIDLTSTAFLNSVTLKTKVLTIITD